MFAPGGQPKSAKVPVTSNYSKPLETCRLPSLWELDACATKCGQTLANCYSANVQERQRTRAALAPLDRAPLEVFEVFDVIASAGCRLGPQEMFGVVLDPSLGVVCQGTS